MLHGVAIVRRWHLFGEFRSIYEYLYYVNLVILCLFCVWLRSAAQAVPQLKMGVVCRTSLIAKQLDIISMYASPISMR